MRRMLVLILLLWPFSAPAQDSPAEVIIGLITLKDDPRYIRDWGYARLVVPPPVRSIDGAEMAISDLAFVSEAMGLKGQLQGQPLRAAQLLLILVSADLQARGAPPLRESAAQGLIRSLPQHR